MHEEKKRKFTYLKQKCSIKKEKRKNNEINVNINCVMKDKYYNLKGLHFSLRHVLSANLSYMTNKLLDASLNIIIYQNIYLTLLMNILQRKQQMTRTIFSIEIENKKLVYH